MQSPKINCFKQAVSLAGGWRSDIKMLRKPKSLCHSGVDLRSSRLHSKRFTYRVISPGSRFLLSARTPGVLDWAYFHKPILTQSPTQILFTNKFTCSGTNQISEPQSIILFCKGTQFSPYIYDDRIHLVVFSCEC